MSFWLFFNQKKTTKIKENSKKREQKIATVLPKGEEKDRGKNLS